jgi:SOS-response transcriptional repressor LexA
LSLEAFWLDLRRNSIEKSEDCHISELDQVYSVDKGSLVPLIAWVSAGEFKEIIDNFQPGYAEDWYMRPKKGSDSVVAMRVRGDSMTAQYGKSYPNGCVIFIDPENRSPETGQPVLAKINGDSEITFKQFVMDGKTKFLKPLNPSYPPIMEKFRILGVVIGKYEDA